MTTTYSEIMLNSYDVTKQSIVYGMFNQYVFTEVKNNIDLIEKFFMTDPSTMTNSLIRDLLHAIRSYDLQFIDEPLFRSILANQGKTDTESDEILSEIVKYKRYDSNQIEPIRSFIRGIGNQSLVNTALRLYPNDPEAYTKYIRTHEYKADMSDVFVTLNFDQLDINSVQADSFGGWPSAFQFINESFQPMMKYENGQIVMVVAPPGCFTGDTLVALDNGRNISMRDLSVLINLGIEYRTYCKCEDGSEVTTQITDCWISKYVNEVTEITVDNTSVRCTDDHKFMMSDGSYKEAKDLKIGDHLMSRNGRSSLVSRIDKVKFNSGIPVYDLSVEDESHNFLLYESEVFVHNCGKTLVK